jgi:hypothetical protein
LQSKKKIFNEDEKKSKAKYDKNILSSSSRKISKRNRRQLIKVLMHQMERNRDRLDLVTFKKHFNKDNSHSSVSSDSFDNSEDMNEANEKEYSVRGICKNIGIKITKQQEIQVQDILKQRDANFKSKYVVKNNPYRKRKKYQSSFSSGSNSSSSLDISDSKSQSQS